MSLKPRIHTLMALGALLGLLILTGACASQSGQSPAGTQLIQATGEIPEEQLLDVGIEVFDPGLPAQGQPIPEDVFPELREAESRYIAIQLKTTMQGTGQWGAVRVLPKGHGVVDLEVSGAILLSTGSKMALDIRAVDATGKEWLERRYRAEADALVYMSTGGRDRGPVSVSLQRNFQRHLEARQKLRAGGFDDDSPDFPDAVRRRTLADTIRVLYLDRQKGPDFTANRLPGARRPDDDTR